MQRHFIFPALIFLLALPSSAGALFPSRLPGSAPMSVERTSPRASQQTAAARRRQERLERTRRRTTPSSTPAPVCGNGRMDRREQCDDGNRLDGDGCSSICVIVPEPVRHGFLRIEEVPVPDDSIVAGQRDKVVLQFRITAGRQDVILHALTLEADQGSAASGRNYRLAIVHDDGTMTTISPVGTSRAGNVTIDKIETLLPVLEQFTFAVVADIVASPSSNRLSLGFPDAPSIHASGNIDGRDLTNIEVDGDGCGGAICWIEVWRSL